MSTFAKFDIIDISKQECNDTFITCTHYSPEITPTPTPPPTPVTGKLSSFSPRQFKHAIESAFGDILEKISPYQSPEQSPKEGCKRVSLEYTIENGEDVDSSKTGDVDSSKTGDKGNLIDKIFFPKMAITIGLGVTTIAMYIKLKNNI